MMASIFKYMFACLFLIVSACAKKTNTKDISQKPTATTELSKMHNAISGSWVSTDDTKSHLSFNNGDTRTDDYNGFEPSSKSYTLAYSCNSQEATETVYIISDNLCWSVDEVTKNTLILTFMGRGNTLTYKRPKNLM